MSTTKAEELVARLSSTAAPINDPDLNDEAAAELRRLAGVEVERDAFGVRLAEAHNDASHYASRCAEAEAERDRLAAEVEALRADAERLDWLESQRSFSATKMRASTRPDALRYWCVENWDGDELTENVAPTDRLTLRAAIDASRGKG